MTLQEIEKQIEEAYKGNRHPLLEFNKKIDALFAEKRRILNEQEYTVVEQKKKWTGVNKLDR